MEFLWEQFDFSDLFNHAFSVPSAKSLTRELLDATRITSKSCMISSLPGVDATLNSTMELRFRIITAIGSLEPIRT